MPQQAHPANRFYVDLANGKKPVSATDLTAAFERAQGLAGKENAADPGRPFARALGAMEAVAAMAIARLERLEESQNTDAVAAADGAA